MTIERRYSLEIRLQYPCHHDELSPRALHELFSAWLDRLAEEGGVQSGKIVRFSEKHPRSAIVRRA